MMSRDFTAPEDALLVMGSNVVDERSEAECKAWDSLARYKFVMFGYWAGVWVHLNRCCPKQFQLANPFRELVKAAKARSA